MRFTLKGNEGDCEVEFDPEDTELVQRFSAAVIEMDRLDREWRDIVRTIPVRECAERRQETGKKIGKILDEVFDAPISEKVIVYNPIAMDTRTNSPMWLVMSRLLAEQFKVTPTKRCRRILRG